MHMSKEDIKTVSLQLTIFFKKATLLPSMSASPVRRAHIIRGRTKSRQNLASVLEAVIA